MSETNFLFELDQATQRVASAVMEAQRAGLACAAGTSRPLPVRARARARQRWQPADGCAAQLPRLVTWAELHRHRRAFLQMPQVGLLTTEASMADAFADYLRPLLG